MRKFLIVISLMLAFAAQADQQRNEQRFPSIHDVFARAQTPTSAATLDQLVIWSELLNTEQLQQQIQTIEDSLPAEQTEWVLFEWLQQQRQQQPSPAVHQTVTALTHHQAKALAAHPDSPFRAIPAFNIAASAAGTLHQWQHDQVFINASQALQRDDASFWSGLETTPRPATLAGLKAAIGQSSKLPAGLPVSLIELANQHPGYAALAIEVGLRHQRAELLNAGLAVDPTLRPVTLLSLDQYWPLAEAESIWRHWLEHTDRTAAAAALSAIGRHRNNITDADQLLLDHLADPQLGGAATQALAQSTDQQTLVQLRERLYASGQPLLNARAAMALRFSQQAEAKTVLSDFANFETSSKRSKLQREISQWLR